MKKILGLDIGTNSVGWAIVNINSEGKHESIEQSGVRIIPMSQDVIDKFGQGQTVSSTAERTEYRGVRRLRERALLRRERLHRVLHLLGFLPKHYDQSIGWDKRDYKTYGKFKPGIEVKLPWVKTDDGHQFIFYSSYLEMLDDLKKTQPHLFQNSSTPVPLDWTIYYLRKKALTQAISKEELAWILLNFNQKRGYYQLRGEEVIDKTKKEEYHALRVVKVELDKDNTAKKPWYKVHLENGWIYRRQSNTPLDNWVGLTKEFIATTSLDKEGNEQTDKEGQVKRSLKAPKEEDWTLVKKKTESDLEKSGKTVGAYIYDTLLQEPHTKIRGGLIKTIERDFYKKELELILTAQANFIPELQDRALFQACAEELYPANYNHRHNLLQHDFKHLFVADIIFYHRPLKTKKSLIANCPYEFRVYYKDHEKCIAPVKCIAKSNPYFQEFRLWQFVHNLKILQREQIKGHHVAYDVDVTSEFLPDEKALEKLFTWLNDRKDIKQDVLLRSYFNLKKDKATKEHAYRWNYVEDKTYPCNETRYLLLTFLNKLKLKKAIKNTNLMYRLWHLLYSVKEKKELYGALQKLALAYQLPSNFADVFIEFPPFEADYGAYSEKAIKKLLPLMRLGSYWDAKNIDSKTFTRISKIIDGEVDDSITTRVREKLSSYRDISQFKGLPLWLAGYVVYNRHSESGDLKQWSTPDDLLHYIQNEFKQYSLRNPIVEQIVLETLRVVHDLWSTYGDFHEIHLELGRDIKNSAEQRKNISNRQQENENTRQRILSMLISLKEQRNLTHLNPYSPSQQEKMRIFEDGVLRSEVTIPKEIEKISSQANPTAKELLKYSLWLEQNYVSPYTGLPIQLSQLFTHKYEIEHVIPQKRYYDNSFSNKVICESEVNKAKGALLAHEFILQKGGSTVTIDGKEVAILKNEAYMELVNRTYGKNNRLKAEKLLAEDLDEVASDFSQRQLNDTRYISRVIQRLLSNVVRDKEEQESTSKHVVACSGFVTNALKGDWGLHDVWSELVQPRFERMNQLTHSNDFGVWLQPNLFQTRVPFDLQKGFSKKRIDHRHHALDAIIIACATRSHINYISNLSARGKEDKNSMHIQLRNKLCYKKPNNGNNYTYLFHKPWSNFTADVKAALQHIVVSHKQNTRVLTKSTNRTLYITAQGNKAYQTQTKGDHYAIRKPMHQETIFGRVSIRKTKKVSLRVALQNWQQLVDTDLKDKIRELVALYGNKYDASLIHQYFKDRDYKLGGESVRSVEVYEFDHDCAAVRKPIDDTLTTKQIDKITDESIRAILTNHLIQFDNDTKAAFSPEGLAQMNKNIKQLNGGKNHHPIYKARFYEDMGSKFALGTTHNNAQKYAIAAKGTNLYFGIYVNQEGKRSFSSIPLNVVIDRLKNKELPVPPVFNKDNLLFSLSPNDLVYVPTPEEEKNPEQVDIQQLSVEQKNRIYKMVSCTGVRCHFLPNNVASVIMKGKEFSSVNKLEMSIDDISIKHACWKLKVNRIGEITQLIR